MDSKTTGKLGEDYASQRLIQDGWKIIARNYRSPYGEIDIIAEKADTIAFIEVKTRASNYMYRPAQAVTPLKQLKILNTAEYYLSQHDDYMKCQMQLDVIEIVVQLKNGFKVTEYNHIQQAFTDTR
ncbi:MAG: YraN family protein [Oscillospiraceae bacterium]